MLQIETAESAKLESTPWAVLVRALFNWRLVAEAQAELASCGDRPLDATEISALVNRHGLSLDPAASAEPVVVLEPPLE
ncbi:MAG: hypothetical protein SF187_02380 [Deltaproteobacteria bacterium]|nr:hypothetical protein [Deltaproteobacteria bacterium]